MKQLFKMFVAIMICSNFYAQELLRDERDDLQKQ